MYWIHQLMVASSPSTGLTPRSVGTSPTYLSIPPTLSPSFSNDIRCTYEVLNTKILTPLPPSK
jgi:hypothetical protein